MAGSAFIIVHCANPSCPWADRPRQLRVDAIGLGQGMWGLLRLVCECGSEPQTESLRLSVEPPVVARVPFKQP